tara:strand:- start:258 stop:584 length:327 start_codon:yes stop_codon:yes gene_type:complete
VRQVLDKDVQDQIQYLEQLHQQVVVEEVLVIVVQLLLIQEHLGDQVVDQLKMEQEEVETHLLQLLLKVPLEDHKIVNQEVLEVVELQLLEEMEHLMVQQVEMEHQIIF